MRLRIVFLLLALSALACGQQIVTPTPTVAPSASPAILPSPTPAPSVTASATVRGITVIHAVVRQPVVRVRDAADGLPTGEYITAGQEVTVLEIDGDWARIKEPDGWVFIGCLEGMSEKGCEAK